MCALPAQVIGRNTALLGATPVLEMEWSVLLDSGLTLEEVAAAVTAEIKDLEELAVLGEAERPEDLTGEDAKARPVP